MRVATFVYHIFRMGTPKRILIVEDDVDIAGPLERTIRRIGYESAGILSTGEEAVAKVSEIRPDVIIMDVVLGGRMTGIEASKQIDPALSLPIIFITGYRPVAAAMEANNRFPLSKPFNAQDLKKAIETALAP
ncbi:MAG: hypothetical protein A2705_02700 [Omnitrophica WOR_2 bacterium RIFCSPHIGHO2_01_FULL_52_10]|nr:MAG: hypothetical protein A2705_02700 [Omnitrophica WOR_2 bacterium RIFCSPHIGHO2_01_FULL_52_10]